MNIEREKTLTVGDARKNQLMISALKIFCEKGYQSATINDIVKKAKCSHGLFYHYFKNKKELFDAVCEWRGLNMMDYLDDLLKSPSNYIDKLYKLTEYTFNNMKRDEIFAYRYYFFVSTIFEKAEKNMLPPKSKCPPHVRMFEFFEQGIKSGDFSDKYSAKECTRLYNCIIQGATLNFILYPKEFKKDFNFPSIQFIIDVFKKEKNNA
ncbi:MAG: TetR/AcrR family transcriptional regulator [Clostridiales bacterium]|nr:TetR/AcrR family transcriptional regulator [Clostridiales bacterium]